MARRTSALSDSNRSGRRAVGGWILLAWLSVLLLPWYKSDSGIFSFAWLTGAADAKPAASLLFHGAPWLWPLVAAPLLATALFLGRQWRGMAAIGALALAWLVAEGFAIIHSGWGFAWLATLTGTRGPVQPGLGWGATFFVLAMLMLVATELADRGWCKGDRFVVGALLLVVASLALFVAYPLLSMLASAVQDNHGNVVPSLFAAKFLSANIWGLRCLSGDGACGVAWNTVALAVLVGVLCTAWRLPLALIALRTRVRAKWLLRMSVDPADHHAAVRHRAGADPAVRPRGHGDDAPADPFRHSAQPLDLRHAGIAIAQVLAFTPIAFLVLVGVLQGVSPSVEEAAQTLRASRWRTFRTVTWPLMRPGLASAFLISFIESMADFANPLVLGGNFNVLSTDIFFAVVGAAHDQGRAAVLAIVLLGFTHRGLPRAAPLDRPAQLRHRRRQRRWRCAGAVAPRAAHRLLCGSPCAVAAC